MADNIAVSEGSGKTVRTDDVGGTQYQIIKLAIGGDGVATDLAFGSAAAAASLPVTASTEDVARTGIITETAPATDTASSGLNGRLQRIAQRITSLIALLPTALGSAAAAASLAVTASTEDVARTGIVTETAPASDTASSGLNGRLQRIAQRITSLIALLPTALGIAARSASLPVVIADINSGEYETVAASQTAQALGASGATGDYLSGVLVIPATTSPGNILLLDNATSITIFTGGASSVSNLVPFFIPLGMYSVSGAWKLTTGANVSAIGIGNFT